MASHVNPLMQKQLRVNLFTASVLSVIKGFRYCCMFIYYFNCN